MSIAYVDRETLARSGDELRFAMQVRFRNAPPRFDSLRAEIRIDCAGRRWGADSSALYLGDALVERLGAADLEPVLPDTNASNVLEGVCGGRFLTGTVDPAAHSRAAFEGR